MIKAGIIGTGNIGCDLLLKMLKCNFIQLSIFSGRNKDSEGIKLAKEHNINTSYEGIDFFIKNKNYCDIVFDCTNAFSAILNNQIELISFMPTNNQHIDARYQNQTAWKESNPDVDIDPVCNDKRSHYISADGFYSPCCFVSDYAFYYKTEFGKNKKMYNITDRTITGLFQQKELNDFYSNLNNHSVCQFSCPATQG